MCILGVIPGMHLAVIPGVHPHIFPAEELVLSGLEDLSGDLSWE